MPEFDFIFTWILIPLMIFFARICDVSIGTLRVIFLSKGYKKIAPILGFFEVIIWLLAITQVMKHIDNFVGVFAYGAGFAAGNYVGMLIEEKLSLGLVTIRIVFKTDMTKFLTALQVDDIGYTLIDGVGKEDKVKILLSIVKRTDLHLIFDALTKFNPNAFYSIEDVRNANQGIFPHNSSSFFKSVFSRTRVKGK